MTDRRQVLAGLGALALARGAAAGAPTFTEGRHYVVLAAPQPTQVPAGKVEVTEVFSYGCPACYQFEAVMVRLKAALPKTAQLNHIHASWNTAESWPLFQRSFITAQLLGVADGAHSAMFDAIWGQNGALAVVDAQTGRLKAKQPTIDDVARFYASKTKVAAADFVKMAKSFGVEQKMRQSDALVKGYKVSGTPTLAVAGKYRAELQSVRSNEEIIALVQFLVQKAAAG